MTAAQARPEVREVDEFVDFCATKLEGIHREDSGHIILKRLLACFNVTSYGSARQMGRDQWVWSIGDAAFALWPPGEFDDQPARHWRLRAVAAKHDPAVIKGDLEAVVRLVTRYY